MIEDGLYRCYETKKFTSAHMEVIGRVELILQEYKGMTLTVRQMFYQGVARGWWPNKQSEYTRLGGIISDGRIAGVLPWNYFEDRGRSLKGYNTFSNPSEAISGAIEEYKLDIWATQDWRPEVWIEKQALEGVIGPICGKYRVDFYSTKGYNSQSEQWRAGQRFAKYITSGQRPIVFHLGDHDPSGMDMTRDVRDRLEMFAGTPVIVQRLALNRHQIDELRPPENPVKFSDSRAEGYVAEHGYASWELDALSPRYISDLLETNITALIDQEMWDEAVEEETTDIRLMVEMTEQLRKGRT